MKIYLVLLIGQGDIQITVLDEEAWNWLWSPMGTEMPETVKKKLRSYREKEYGPGEFSEDEIEVIYETSGSYVNDRALSLPSTVDGYKNAYCSLADFVKKIQETGDEVEDTWEGCIY